MISCFHRSVNEVLPLLECCAVMSGSYGHSLFQVYFYLFSVFRCYPGYNCLASAHCVPCSINPTGSFHFPWEQISIKLHTQLFPLYFLDCLTLENGTNGLSWNVCNYHSMLHNIPEKQKPHAVTSHLPSAKQKSAVNKRGLDKNYSTSILKTPTK